jgi:hypothetical protein
VLFLARYASTYTTVRTVCTSSLLGCLVDLDVLDDEVSGVETLGVGVGLSILEEAEKELGGLDGPAGASNTEGLALGGTTSSTSVTSHGNGLLVLLDVLEELHSTLQLPAIDSLRRLAGVLERHSQVLPSGPGRLGGVDFGGTVSNLQKDPVSSYVFGVMSPEARGLRRSS